MPALTKPTGKLFLPSVLIYGIFASSNALAFSPTKLETRHAAGYIIFSNKEEGTSYWLDGRGHIDVGTVSGVDENIDDRFFNASQIRRARFGVKFQFKHDWFAEWDMDIAEGDLDIEDLWLAYEGFDNVIIRFGNQKSGLGMDNQTSSRALTFMERSMLSDLIPSRRISLNLVWFDDRFSLSANYVIGDIGDDENANEFVVDEGDLEDVVDDLDDFDTGDGDDANDLAGIVEDLASVLEDAEVDNLDRDTRESEAFVLRGTSLLIKSDDTDVHFGLSYGLFNADASFENRADNRLRLRVKPNAEFLSNILSETIRDVDKYTLAGIEWAGRWRQLYFQSEYLRMDIDRLDDNPAYSYDGYYAALSYAFNGRRYYSSRIGEFSAPFSKDNKSVYELALRIDNLNLNDVADNRSENGEVDTYTAAFNWYPNTNFRTSVNLIHISGDENSRARDESFNAVAIRGHFYF